MNKNWPRMAIYNLEGYLSDVRVMENAIQKCPIERSTGRPIESSMNVDSGVLLQSTSVLDECFQRSEDVILMKGTGVRWELITKRLHVKTGSVEILSSWKYITRCTLLVTVFEVSGYLCCGLASLAVESSIQNFQLSNTLVFSMEKGDLPPISVYTWSDYIMILVLSNITT